MPIEEVLLKEVAALQKHYDFISEFTGENFNIFKTLQLEANEVRTHSAILAEFLNPKGSHGQKDLFLKLFIETIKIEDFDTSSATAKTEVYTGAVNSDNTKGGRIDILITDKLGNHIIIENKIYARDQKNQLVRYHNFDTQASLFYLTLDGHPPNDWSTKRQLDLGKDFNLLSYSDEILNWLEKCKKEATSLPIIRETISQYLQLINYLTGNSINKAMENDLATTISKNKDYISSAFTISNSLELVKKYLIKKLVLQLKEIAIELELEGVNEDFGEGKNSYFWFYLKESKYETAIGLGFEEGMKYFIVGVQPDHRFDRDPDKFNEIRSQVSQRLSIIIESDEDKNEVWFYFHSFKESLGNWYSSENWEKIPTGELKSELKEIIEKIKKALEDVNL